MMFFLFIFMLFNACILNASPFELEFSAKENLTVDDYQILQEKLKSLDIVKYLDHLYPEMNKNYLHSFDFRVTKGTKQVLIDSSKGLYPKEIFQKIGVGGDVCIVCSIPFNGVYSDLIESVPKALLEVGFNGYYFCQIGGFPNPTGEEIQYAAVPYSFKIFMMLEAYKKGFKKVLWMDASLLPVNKIDQLIDFFDLNESFLIGGSYRFKTNPDYILPIAKEALIEITGSDPTESKYICTMLFGMNMESIKAKRLIELYYQCVERGTPFFSYFPEEVVFTSIVDSLKEEKWPFFSDKRLILAGSKGKSYQDKCDYAKKKGYIFYYRDH